MRSFNLTKERQARIWLDEIPGRDQNAAKAKSYRIEQRCDGDARIVRSSIAVELFIPLGGRFQYGFLGCQLAGSESKNVAMEVQTSPHRVELQGMESLAGKLDNVVPWIDDEYFEPILEGAGLAVRRYEKFPEKLLFSSGRQGVFGSSPAVFRRLAFICVSLMSVAEIDLGQRLEELVSSPLD